MKEETLQSKVNVTTFYFVESEVDMLYFVPYVVRRAKKHESQMGCFIEELDSDHEKQTAAGVYAMLEATVDELPPITQRTRQEVTQEVTDGCAYFISKMRRKLQKNSFLLAFMDNRMVCRYEEAGGTNEAMNDAMGELITALAVYRMIEIELKNKDKEQKWKNA